MMSLMDGFLLLLTSSLITTERGERMNYGLQVDGCVLSLWKGELTSSGLYSQPGKYRISKSVFTKKALNMYLADVIALQSILKAFNPATLGEQQDVASAKLFMIIDLNDVLQVIVLKLS